MINKNNFSIVYQITQECPFNCQICLRYFKDKSSILTQQERFNLIKILKEKGLKRLAVTGGEPTLLRQELYDFLRYVHKQKIHTSLVTTGISLTRNKILFLNDYIDHMLVSVRSFEIDSISNDFQCSKKTAEKLLDNILLLIDLSKRCDFFLEINTVVHKQNITSIFDFGEELLKLSQKIIWRIDEYYPIGLQKSLRDKFELKNNEFDFVIKEIIKKFSGKFRNIRYLSSTRRSQSPEYLITQEGKLITTSNYIETETMYDFRKKEFPEHFITLRSWSEHQSVCRDFGWKE